MKQKLLHLSVLLMSGVLAFSLAACSKGNSTSSSIDSESAEKTPPASETEAESSLSSESDAEEEVTSADEDVTSTEDSTKPSGDLSDDIYSQQIEIDGVVYTFPLESVQEFMDNGWATDKDLDYTMPKNTISPGYTFKNSDAHSVVLAFINQGNETIDLMECNVYYVSLTKRNVESTGLSYTLPGGIQLGAAYDEVIAAYGSADEEKDYDNISTTKLIYGTNNNNIELSFDQTAGNTLQDVTINFKDPVQ